MNYLVKHKLDKFFANFPIRSYGKHEIMIYADSDPGGVYYLKSGQVKQYDINSHGDETIVNIFKPNSFFPMTTAVNRTTNRYFFEATIESEVAIAPAASVLAFLYKNPDVAFDLLTRLLSGIEGVERRMAHLMGGHSRNLIIFELIIECRRFGIRSGLDSYRLNIHEDELARRSGLTRETISRELKKLKSLELIDISHKGFTVRRLSKLEKLIDSDL